MSLPSTAVPRLSSTASAGDFFTGLSLPWRAGQLVLRGGRLLTLVLVAAGLVGLTLVALLVWLAPWMTRVGKGWLGEGGAAWGALGTALGVLLALGTVVAGALTLPNLVLAPLQDPLGEATEACLGDFRSPPFSPARFLRGVWISLKHTLLRIVFMLAGVLLLLPLNLIPGVGTLLFSALSITWTAWWLSVEYLSGTMARHLLPFRAVLRVLWGRRALALGFGASLYLLLWVPVVNFFLMPVAIVAGALLYRALQEQGLIRNP